MKNPGLFTNQAAAQRRAGGLLCGVDEAGRGPLAGPVCCAAVILKPGVVLETLDDSKKVSPRRREALYDEVLEKAEAWSISLVDNRVIDDINILQATLLGMRQAVEGLSLQPSLTLVDGNSLPLLSMHTETVVHGDGTYACIAAASILAKVTRDRLMLELSQQYPQYGFAQHKGYGTRLHYERLAEFGPSPVHRMSFLKEKSQ